MIRSMNIRVKAKRLYNSYDISMNSIIDRYFSLGDVSKYINKLSGSTSLIAWRKETAAYYRNLHTLEQEIIQDLAKKCIYKESYSSGSRVGYTKSYPFVLNINTCLSDKDTERIKERTTLTLANGQEISLTDYIAMYDMVKTTGEEKEELNSLVSNKAINEDVIDNLEFTLNFEEYRGIRPKLLFRRENRIIYNIILIFDIREKNK